MGHMRKEREEQEKEQELEPTATTTKAPTNTVAEEITATKEPAETTITKSSRKPSKATSPQQEE